MDVVVCTTEEPLFLPRYLEPAVEHHADAIAEVVLAPPTSRLRTLRRLYRMYGPRAFPRVAGRFVRAKALDALPDGLGYRLTGRYHGVASLARAHGLAVHRVPDVADPGFVARVEAVDPNVLLSVVCGQKLPPAVLDAADVAINVHGSLLPRYRGRGTAFWPLYYGDDATGVTAHLMTEEFDAGPIVEQRRFPIEPDDTVHDVYAAIADVGSDLVVDLLDRLERVGVDAVETRPNPTRAADYHSIPTAEERRQFLDRGNRFV